MKKIAMIVTAVLALAVVIGGTTWLVLDLQQQVEKAEATTAEVKPSIAHQQVMAPDLRIRSSGASFVEGRALPASRCQVRSPSGRRRSAKQAWAEDVGPPS